MRPKPIIPQFHQMVLTVALHKKSPAGFWTSPIRIRRSPMSNSHVQSAKAIAEDIAHLCCVPDDWRLQISDLAAWPFPTFCAKLTRCIRALIEHRIVVSAGAKVWSLITAVRRAAGLARSHLDVDGQAAADGIGPVHGPAPQQVIERATRLAPPTTAGPER